jgi:hypothetical protein
MVTVGGKRYGVLPAKDGAVYLFDADHFGNMLDRLPLREFCGSNGGTCTANWAGTMVTKPLVVDVDGEPVIVIPTFYFDQTNPAGVVALQIRDIGNGPVLQERWHAPKTNSSEAVSRFREHTGRAAELRMGDTSFVVVADPGPENSREGLLYGINAVTGDIEALATLDGPGQKYAQPAVIGSRAFVTSCQTIGQGPAHLEGWELRLSAP